MPSKNQHGVALIAVLMVLFILFAAGIAILTVSTAAFQTSRAYSGSMAALHVADSGLQQLVGKQNDDALSPRYLFDANSYQSSTPSNDVRFVDFTLIANDVSAEVLGLSTRQVIGPDPRLTDPPYLVESTGTYRGAQRVVRGALAPLNLLQYALWSETSITFLPGAVINGAVYAPALTMQGCGVLPAPCITFNGPVEYVNTINNQANGQYNRPGNPQQILARDSLTALINLPCSALPNSPICFENAAKQMGICGTGIGLYIGLDDDDGDNAGNHGDNPGQNDKLRAQNNLFRRDAECRKFTAAASKDNMSTVSFGTPTPDPDCWQIDLGLFDFTANPITYNGEPLRRWDIVDNVATPLLEDALTPAIFNGVIFIDNLGNGATLTDNREVHIWGINGQRSAEDFDIQDAQSKGVLPAGDGTPVMTPYGAPNCPLPCNTLDVLCANGPERCYVGPCKPGELVPAGAVIAECKKVGHNFYSNNQLDSTEDGAIMGCPATEVCTPIPSNGQLDARGRGRNLTIVTANEKNFLIDHNIFMGRDANGRAVRTAMISGNDIYIDHQAPRTIVFEAALMAKSTWLPAGQCTSGAYNPGVAASVNSHLPNQWAKLPTGTYQYDLDYDFTIEASNGQPVDGGDINETSMLNAYALQSRGNLIVRGIPQSGCWSTDNHIRLYLYDQLLLTNEPPCYPILPDYGIVPGTWVEMR